MPRPLFGRSNKPQVVWKPTERNRLKEAVDLHGQYNPEQRLRRTRSSAYTQIIQHLDVDEKVLNEEKMYDVIERVEQEFADLAKESLPIGIVAVCQLGHPFEVHTLDLQEEIITHYKASQPLPEGLEKARNLALHPSYAFVEVYPDCMRVIDKSGEVSVIRD